MARSTGPADMGSQLRWAPPAVAIVALVLLADVVTGSNVVLVGLLSAAPLLGGLTATPRATLRLGCAVTVIAAASVAWNDTWGSWAYWVPLTVVTLSTLFGWRTAVNRGRLRREAARSQVLADLSHVGQGRMDAGTMAGRFCEVLVPAVCDLAVIDLVDDVGLRHAAGAFSGDRAVLDAFLRRPPSAAPAAGSAAAARTGEVQRLVRSDDAFLRQVAVDDDDDLKLLERLELDNAVVVPLVARDRPIGTVSYGSRSPAGSLVDDDSVGFLRLVAGRVALAIDNARLADDLARAEQRLQAILANADVAVMVRSADGRLVYANQTAADLLDVPDASAIAAQTSQQLMDLFDVYDEDGAPVPLTDLPGARVLRGEPEPAPAVVRSVIRRTGRERWLLNRATAIRGSDGGVEMAVNLIDDITEIKRSDIAQRLLAHAAQVVSEAAELEPTLQAIVDAAVPGLADWAGVDLVDQRGRVTTVAVAHRDPERLRPAWRLRGGWPADLHQPDGVSAVIRSGRPQLVAEVTEDMLEAGARDRKHLELLRAVGVTSTMVVPVRAGERILGALSFVSSTSRRFDERDLRLAEDLGRQTGVLIANVQLQAERVHVAQTLEAGLLPERFPAVPGWRVTTAYRAAGAANEVGGDFYDIIAFDGGWSAVVGDVVGKGAGAAVLTALARHTLAAIIESTGDPLHALTLLNRRLRERAGGGFANLCTIAAVTVRDARAEVVCAGHPAPLLIRGETVTPIGRPGMLLGAVDDVRVAGAPVDLRGGDQLLLYTDGVTDAVGARERFGNRRLIETVTALARDGVEDLAAQLLGAVDAFAVGEQADDIAILAVRREQPESPALAA